MPKAQVVHAFGHRLSRRVALALTLALTLCAALALAATFALVQGGLRAQMLARAETAVETMRRDMEYAIYAGVPADRLRGVEALAEDLAARTPEVRAITFAPAAPASQLNRVRAIVAAMPPPEPEGWVRAATRARGAARDLAAMLVPGGEVRLTQVVRAELRVFGAYAGMIGAELDMGYVRGKMLDALFDAGVIVVVVILVCLELVMIVLLASVVMPGRIAKRALARAAAGDLSITLAGRGLSGPRRLLRRLVARHRDLHRRAAHLAAAGGARAAALVARARLGVVTPAVEMSVFDVRIAFFLAFFAEAMLTGWMPLFVREVLIAQGTVPAGYLLAAPIVAVTAAGFAVTLSAPVWPAWLTLRRAALLGLGLAVAGQVLAFAAPDVWLLVGSRLVVGAGLAMLRVSCTDYVAQIPPGVRDDREEVAYKRLILTATMAGIAVGAILAEWAGFRPVFVMAAGLSLVAMLPAWRLIDGAVRPRVGSQASRWGAIAGLATHRPTARVLMSGVFVPALAHHGFVFFLVPLRLAELGVAPSYTGRVLLCYVLLAILFFSVFFGPARRFAEGPGAGALQLAAFCGAMVLTAQGGTLGVTLAVIGLGPVSALSIVQRDARFSHARGTRFSESESELQKNLSGQLGGIAAPLLTGVIVTAAGLAAAPLVLCALAVALTLAAIDLRALAPGRSLSHA